MSINVESLTGKERITDRFTWGAKLIWMSSTTHLYIYPVPKVMIIILFSFAYSTWKPITVSLSRMTRVSVLRGLSLLGARIRKWKRRGEKKEEELASRRLQKFFFFQRKVSNNCVQRDDSPPTGGNIAAGLFLSQSLLLSDYFDDVVLRAD